MRKFSVEGYPLSTREGEADEREIESMRKIAHKFLLSVLEAMSKRFRGQSESPEIARLHHELNCEAPTPEALEQATLYCTSERCRGLDI